MNSHEELFFILFFKIFFNVYFWDRERQSMNEGGAEREGDTESEAGSRLWAISPEPDAGLELMDREIVTWAEVGRLTDWATQAPLEGFKHAHFTNSHFSRTCTHKPKYDVKLLWSQKNYRIYYS